MSYTTYKRGKAYFLYFRMNGDRHRISLQTKDKETAEIVAKELYNNALKESYGIAIDVTVQETMDGFKDYSMNHKKSWKTDISLINNIIEFFGSHTKIVDLKPSAMFDFKVHLRDRGYSTSSINHNLTAIKTAINLLIEDGKFDGKNPVRGKKLIVKTKTKSKSFTAEEVNKILGYAKNISTEKVSKNGEPIPLSKSQKYFYPFIYFLLHTGCRSGEIFKLRWRDVKPNYITLYGTKSHADQNDWDVIPCVPQLYDFMQTLPKDSFLIINTNQQNTNTFRKIFLKMRFDLELDNKATFHWIRHTVTSYLSEKGVPPTVLQAIMRHSNYSTTQIYTHTQISEMAKAMKHLDFAKSK